MDLQPSPSSQFLKSTFTRSMHLGQQIISLGKIIQECSKMSIDVIQLPDIRLQNGLNAFCFKTKNRNQKDCILVFASKFKDNELKATSYFDGKKMEKLVRYIKKWTDGKKDRSEDIRQKSIQTTQRLNKKCQQIAKSQSNQLMAMQKLKTTNQYRNLIELQIQVSMQIQSLTQLLIQTKQGNEAENGKFLAHLLKIEKLKDQIQEYQYEYEEVSKYLRNTKQHLNQFIQIEKSKVESMKIGNEKQLTEFINQCKKLKKLELQKIFLL